MLSLCHGCCSLYKLDTSISVLIGCWSSLAFRPLTGKRHRHGRVAGCVKQPGKGDITEHYIPKCFDIGPHHANFAQLVRKGAYRGRHQDIIAGEETADDPARAVHYVYRLGIVARRELAGIFAPRPGNGLDIL